MRLGANKVTFVMKVDVNIINSYLYGLFLCNGFVLPPENEEVGQLRVFVIDRLEKVKTMKNCVKNV
jgi:hypothetical protein